MIQSVLAPLVPPTALGDSGKEAQGSAGIFDRWTETIELDLMNLLTQLREMLHLHPEKVNMT
ncbi:hypothetical protein N7523_011131 [Penicillium sp. IBT 18751x]|nr:hypothetical protein N7523_011131 [Penicillium sp. IBT 18751x]